MTGPVREVDVGPAEPADAPVILDIQRDAYRIEAERYGVDSLPPIDETLDELRAAFATHTILVARRDGEVVGAVRARVEDGTAHVGRLAVRVDLHGHGIGRRLLEAIEAATAHADRYELFTGAASHRNLRLYRSAGYHVTRTKRISERVSLTWLEKDAPGTGEDMPDTGRRAADRSG